MFGVCHKGMICSYQKAWTDVLGYSWSLTRKRLGGGGRGSTLLGLTLAYLAPESFNTINCLHKKDGTFFVLNFLWCGSPTPSLDETEGNKNTRLNSENDPFIPASLWEHVAKFYFWSSLFAQISNAFTLKKKFVFLKRLRKKTILWITVQ